MRDPVVFFLWFASPSRLNQRLANNGTQIAKYHEAVNMASEATFTTHLKGCTRHRGKGDEGMGIGRKAVAAFLRQWLGRRHLLTNEFSMWSLEDVAPLVLWRVPYSSLPDRDGSWDRDGRWFWYCPETWQFHFPVVNPNSLKKLIDLVVRSGDRPKGGAKGVWLKRACFGSLFRKASFGKPAEITSADNVEMETGATWTKIEWDPRTLQIRDHLLTEFWAIFVDDIPFQSGSLCWHCMFNQKLSSPAQWQWWTRFTDRWEKWVGSKFAAWEMQERLKRSMLYWVCAGTFDDHDWVSESTIAEQEEEVMGRDLDHKHWEAKK